jgi:hypothetical protein
VSRARAALIGASRRVVVRTRVRLRVEVTGSGVERVYERGREVFVARMFEKVETRLEQVFGTDVRRS